MELEKLAQEYRKSAERLEERVNQLREGEPEKRWGRDPKLEKRILLLQNERYQLLWTACYLENYHKNEQQGWRRR